MSGLGKLFITYPQMSYSTALATILIGLGRLRTGSIRAGLAVLVLYQRDEIVYHSSRCCRFVPGTSSMQLGVTTAFHLPSDGACTCFSML